MIMILAHPAGNPRSLTYWLAYNDTSGNLAVTLEAGSLRSAFGPNGLHGLALRFSSNPELGTTQIGSVRQVRGYVEGGGVSQSLFNFTVTQLHGNAVWFSRPWLNESTVTLDNATTISGRHGYELRFQAENGTRFQAAPSTNSTSTPSTARTSTPSGGPGRVSWSAQVNETNIPSLSVNQVFASDATGNTSLAGVCEQFAFLTYKQKQAAGSWRFLTYLYAEVYGCECAFNHSDDLAPELERSHSSAQCAGRSLQDPPLLQPQVESRKSPPPELRAPPPQEAPGPQ
ncbi:hypothetical protein FRC10_002330 [Ceratobasidium sp. 414]|nr:hypothetical protein FRC10_002330 [Ceratobasidium sp. 414]